MTIPEQIAVSSPEGLDEKNENRQDGPVEFGTVTLPVPQAAASGLLLDDLSCLHCRRSGNIKTVPAQQGRMGRESTKKDPGKVSVLVEIRQKVDAPESHCT